MGRSSAQQALRNRTRIVEEASRLFRERGVGAVSVSDVMGAVGMTVGGFYKHFASKEALVEEACALSFDQAAQVWRNLVRRDDGTKSVAAIIDHYFITRPAHLTCPMLAYAPHVSDTDFPPVRQVYSDGTGALLSDFLSRDDRNDDCEATQETQVLFAAMIGAQLLAQASGHADWATALQKSVLRWATKEHLDGGA